MAGNEGAKPLKLLFTLLSVILISALLVFSYALWTDVKSSQFDKLYKQNQTLISQSRTFFDHQTRLIIKTFQSVISANNINSDDATNTFDYLLSTTDEAASYALLKPNGQLLLSHGDIEPSPPNEQFLTVIQRLRSSKTAQIGYLFRSGLLGEYYLPFYVPLLDEKKNIIAIAASFYRVQGEHSVMKKFINLDENTVWLLGEQGLVRMSYPVPKGFVSDLLGWRLAQETVLSMQDSLRAGNSRDGIELEIKGGQVLANVGYLPEYQLISLNSVPQTKLIQIWLDRIQPIASVFALFLVAAILAYRIALKISRNIAEARLQAEGKIQKLSKAIEQSPNSVVITDNNWSIEYANSHFDLLNAKPNARKQAKGKNIFDYPPYNLMSEILEKVENEIRNNGSWFGERKTDFEAKWYSFSVSHITNNDGQITHYVVVVQDISSRKEAEAKLFKQAYFDPLTELPNRRKANENLTKELQNAWQSKQKVAVLYLDIDNFKNVNDTFGHLIGDQLLQLIAGRLVKTSKGHGHVCHISGDEFLIYVSYEDKTEIDYLANRILRDIEKPVSISGKQIYNSASIGIACYPDDNNDVVGLMKFADIALYESKKAGRNRYSYFDHKLDQLLKRRHQIETELRTALKHNEIYMVYQSKNDIQNESIIGFEALMRWKSKALGEVSPVEFIEIAEEIGVIDELGEFALQQACVDLQEFQNFSSQPLRMAVNLSVRQLNDANIVNTVADIIKTSGIDPKLLELEITESMLAENLDKLLPRLEGLLQLGTSLTIDDFGTGYSSLSYLTTFPVSTLKVDRAFVKDMVTNSGDATLTNTIITMSHALSLKVVAEGIEDRDQLKMLQNFGCDIGQGYLFSKPLTKHEMIILVETNNLPETTSFGTNT